MSDDEFTELVESTNSPAAKRIAELERELEQERQDRKQAELDVCRALGERNDARAIIHATLKALPVGYIPAHTPESLPGRVADLVSELAAERALADRLAASLDLLVDLDAQGMHADHAEAHTAERALAAWRKARNPPSGYNP